MKYLLLLLLPLSLFASKILSYNIYNRSDRADVMITFDTPYSGIIKQSRGKNRIIIKLEDATIESTKIKKMDSSYLHSLTIAPLKNETEITAYTGQNVQFIASKTSDSYGLRLRFTHKSAVKSSTTQKTNSFTTNLSALPTKKDGGMTRSYYIVVAILIIGIIILLYIKKRITNAPISRGKESWLFNAAKGQMGTQAPNMATEPISIRFQKAIDSKNSAIILDFGEESYFIFVGNNNSFLIDKITDNKPNTQQDFDTFLQERSQQLENYLEAPSEQHFNSTTALQKEPLDAYKERAASFSYGE